MLYPAKALLLATGSGYPERVRGGGPFYQTMDESGKKKNGSEIGYDDAEKAGESKALDPRPGDQDEEYYCNQRVRQPHDITSFNSCIILKRRN